MSQAPTSAGTAGAAPSQGFTPYLVPGAAGATAPAAPVVTAEASPALKGYDALLEGPLVAYVTLSAELGGLTAQQVRTTALTSPRGRASPLAARGAHHTH